MDTEKAFLLALRLTGQVSKAAAEIGRSKNTACSRRKSHPDFARKWDDAVAAQQREWIAAHQERLALRRGEVDDVALEPGQERAGGWDARKRGLFLRALARTKRVDMACEAAEMVPRAAHALRARSPRFAAAWEKALTETAPPSVIGAALARAVEGWDEPIVQGGDVVAYRRRFSDGLLRDLLRAELARVGETRQAGVDFDAAKASILRKIEAIERHDDKVAAEAQRAAWTRWRESWGRL
ncbi:MAG: hypothetical protein V4574_18735 [Pseudomonadota bacterium]